MSFVIFDVVLFFRRRSRRVVFRDFCLMFFDFDLLWCVVVFFKVMGDVLILC